ncbi:MAG: TetR/AcrR family transcriptional regulator [Novosphingobium sp.]
MRVKTDERRQAIMEAAAELFGEVGFERASMAAISARLGGSKATLYSYFKSKEELFAAVMVDSMTEQADKMIDLLAGSADDLGAVLLAFGEAYLDLVLSNGAIAMLRTGMVDGNRDRLGPVLYATGPQHGWDQVARKLASWSDEGRLAIANPTLAAYQLKGLLEAGLMEPKLYGAEPALDRNLVIRSAIDGFLRIYLPA